MDDMMMPLAPRTVQCSSTIG